MLVARIQWWRQQVSMITLKPINLLACEMHCVGICTFPYRLMKMGVSAVYLVHHEWLLFHCLTCVEQYVVVMHPLIYLNLKIQRRVLARNAIIAFVWLVSVLNLVFQICRATHYTADFLVLRAEQRFYASVFFVPSGGNTRSHQHSWCSYSISISAVKQGLNNNSGGYQAAQKQPPRRGVWKPVVTIVITLKDLILWALASFQRYILLDRTTATFVWDSIQYFFYFSQWQNWWVFAWLLVSLIFKRTLLIWKVNVKRSLRSPVRATHRYFRRFVSL